MGRIAFVSCCAVLATLLFASTADAARAVIVIRHAEKESQPPDDPDLSIPGEDRAIALTRFLRHNKVDAIFVSEFKRTQKTADVLAHQRGITPVITKAADTAGLVAKINALPADAVVVVVGHSNTVPEILAALGVKEKVSIRDDEFNRVFVVTPQPVAPAAAAPAAPAAAPEKAKPAEPSAGLLEFAY